ncbi:preprotein translocase subunit SecE [Pseudoxanthomonas spadix]|jgi:preprotein translocase subunit SecE|uniref:Protein translocase subunit SecE n=1 Tax=Pseudoxanthomonas spadix (strain BD-a59) TaxID=1045855 RepID=G7US14_PSEUP|nr:preprotein translocase subunit SecE [Pseudoxanthomonas spadix]AER57222.1 preprotein translocase subunit SecE [Pseudoxanthomonas spadix BD-a59]MBP3975279.1 preprotein translocase subunit SecE [Pseudoxanthomonas spadix]RMW95698.1 preprotein translocase subunit SecE [Pseudoxanthomonas spadix]
MNSKIQQSKAAGTSGADMAKYVAAAALVVAGLVVWWWFAGQWATPLRALAVVAGLVAGAAVFISTAKGKDTLEFLSESRFELRKVVWPTRQESLRMTWVVMVVVLILSLILAGFDFGIQWMIEKLFTMGR